MVQEKYVFNITNMQAEDVEPVARMVMQSWIETYVNADYGISEDWINQRYAEKLKPEALQEKRDRLEETKNNPNFGSFIAKDENGKVIGMATPYRDEEGRQQLGALYVDKKYHGKGVAGELMKKVFEWSNPSEPMYLGVVVFNERAKAFYRKWGFSEIPGSERMHDNVIPEIVMMKEGVK